MPEEHRLPLLEPLLADVRDQIDGLAGPIHGLEEEIRALTSNAADVQTEILKQSQKPFPRL